jgi:RHS repeat-associated protein
MNSGKLRAVIATALKHSRLLALCLRSDFSLNEQRSRSNSSVRCSPKQIACGDTTLTRLSLCPFRLLVLSGFAFLLSPGLSGQTLCFHTCAPNPGSGTYSSNIGAQFQPRNARGMGSPTVPAQKSGNSTTILGSSSYSSAIPILHLPGRAGLDLDLTLYYNSGVWTFNSSNTSVTFNADRDWPSYGFRLDFGLAIDDGGDKIFVIEANGAKHALPNSVPGVSYDSQDSTYMDFAFPAPYTLKYKNGMQVLYEVFPSSQPQQPLTFFRPIRINDTNGNFITITYMSGTDQQINTVTDTLGRVVQFNYDGNGNLTSITSNSGTRTWATFTWNTGYTLNYNFSATVSDSPANGAALNVLTGVTLPNNTQYTFTYGAWGMVKQISNLSNSGQTRDYQAYNYPDSSTALSAPPTYTQQTVSDGATTRVWTYSNVMSNNMVSQSTIADPSGTSSVTNLYTAAGDWKDGLQSSIQIKDSNGKLLRQIDNTWTADATTNANSRLSSVLTTLSDTGQQSRVDFVSYDANGCVTDQKEYDFGLTLKREIVSTYLTGYASSHILNLPTQVIVKDANGNNVSRTDYAYDGGTPSTITGAANHNDSYSSPRGNLTSVTRYTDPAGGTGAITRNFTYDSLGNLLTAQLDCCNQKQWNFSSGTQYAYPDSVVRGPSGGTQLTTSATYNLDTGTVATTTDENLKVTHLVYDSMNRVSTVTQPDSVVITYTYDDASASPSLKVSSSANSAVQKTVFDGLGRTTQSQLLNGSTLLTTRDTQYDDINRQVKNSNPHSPTEGQVWTTNQFDALGRLTLGTPPSGGNYRNSYNGNAMLVTDPSGKQKRSFSDYAGRLIQVDEPSPGSMLPGTSGAGSIVVSGAEQITTTPGTKATGSFTVNGQAYCYRPWICVDTCVKGPTTCDSGTVSVTINGVTYSTSYSTSTTAAAVASALAAQMSGSPVSANNLGTGTVNLTADQPGPNYSLSWSAISNNPDYFDPPSVSVTLSGATMTGGAYPVTTYDSGTMTVTVNGFTASASYNQNTNTTASAMTGALTAALNAPNSPVTASQSGTTIYLAAKNYGAATNFTVTGSSSASFTVSSTTLTGGQDPQSTFYAYNPLGNLTTVTQGAQTRTYNYDGGGRLTSSAVPESGTTSFTYYDYGAVNTRTDARGVITTYGYDGLHRLASVSYNVGSTGVPATPSVSFAYGTSTSANNNGRLITMTDGVGSENYTYDTAMGRIAQIAKVINGTTYNIGYGYNSAGELNALVYPSGRVVNPGYDNIGRLTQITTGGVHSDPITSYLSGMNYNSAQFPTGFTYGNGVLAAFGYNDHLQLSSLSYTSGSNTLLNLTYNYADVNGNNNGQIQGITDSRGAAYSTTYNYDPLGRLAQAQTNDLSSANTWKLVWGYDRYGNRLSQTLTGGTISVGQPQLNVDATTNRITSSGFSYDSDGNLKQDPNGTYTFDAENRMTQSLVGSATTSYAYDGGHMRVVKGTTVYIYSGSNLIAEYAGGSLTREYVYSESKLVATIAGSTVTYHHSDLLSSRLETDTSGGIARTFGHLPFGATWYETGATDNLKFTTYMRDAESGFDYALNRFYSNGYGRFQSADFLGGHAPNPQTLNRYAYVMNNPVNFTDPLGMSGRPIPYIPPPIDWRDFEFSLLEIALTPYYPILDWGQEGAPWLILDTDHPIYPFLGLLDLLGGPYDRTPDDLNVLIGGTNANCSPQGDQPNQLQITVSPVKDSDKLLDVTGFGQVSNEGAAGNELQGGVTLVNANAQGQADVRRPVSSSSPSPVYLKYTASAGGTVVLDLYVTLNASSSHYWGKEYKKVTVPVEDKKVKIKCRETSAR